MWTPKRILMLVTGFVLFIVAYIGYAATSVGRIDGLPPLPEKYLPGAAADIISLPPRNSQVKDKLRQAFGPGCEELEYTIQLEVRPRNMVLAARDYDIKDDGWVLELKPLSVALFSKDHGDGRGVEINTIHSRVARLKFDRPIRGYGEIGSRKIVEAELIDSIEIVNNHRTPARDDDLSVTIAKGPLYYIESQQRIWTSDHVHLVDNQSKPKPTMIDGDGMEVELLAEPPPPKLGLAPPKPKGDGITGVKRIVLKSDVDMHLYVGGSGFPAGDKDGPPAPPHPPLSPRGGRGEGEGGVAAGNPPAEPEKAHVHIHSPGRFQYDFFKDHDLARFDESTASPGQPAHRPQYVMVLRSQERPSADLPDGAGGASPPGGQKQTLYDQLVCRHLELRLRRKDTAPGPTAPPGKPAPKPGAEAAPPGAAGAVAAPPTAEHSLEIETAHATAGPREVVLTSDAEGMRAEGNDFFYDARTRLTVLKGGPEMEAEDKDGSIIHARELQIQEVQDPAPPRGGKVSHQQVVAVGPGNIHMRDKKTQKLTTHAFWNDKLTSTKDGPHDLLVLTGAARFQDEENDQLLQGETLKVWLSNPVKPGSAAGVKPGEAAVPAAVDAGETPAPPGAEPSGGSSLTPQGRRPEHVEATGNVVARSRELNIHNTGRLVVKFKDAPPPRAVLPPTVPDNRKQAPGTKEAGGAAGAGGRVGPPAPAAPPATAGPTLPPPDAGTRPAGPGAAGTGAAPAKTPAKTSGEGMGGDPDRPIDLSARSVEAEVLRGEVKNVLNNLWCEGYVRVRQDPARPGEKGVNIEGDTLRMIYNPAGNSLVVTGAANRNDDSDMAKLLMDKILIIGPEVNIDQARNMAWVYGAGLMRMESTTTFQGDALKEPVPLVVDWSESMFFNGDYAHFRGNPDRGGVNATQEKENAQDSSRMSCLALQVFFDRPISLKEGNHGEQPARVKHMACDRNVHVEDSTYEKGKLVKYQKVVTPSLIMHALEEEGPHRPGQNGGNKVSVSGPGEVRLLQYGQTDPAAPPGGNKPPPKPAAAAKPASTPAPGSKPAAGDKPAEEEMKMTFVSFQHRMNANSKMNTAWFYGDVRVLNFPCENPNQEINLDLMLAKNDLPEGGMYLRCDKLTVLSRPLNGKSNQEMKAEGGVLVQTKDFYARADQVDYNEAKDQIIFLGTGKDGRATLSKFSNPGDRPQRLDGRKIIYTRSTGYAQVDGGEGIQGQN